VSWKDLSKREKLLGIMTAACVVALSVGQWGREYMRDRFSSLDGKIATLSESISKTQLFLGRQSRMEEEFQQALKIFGDPADEQTLMTQMLSAINTAARSKDVQLQEINSLPAEHDQGKRMVRIKTSLAGSWPSMLELFNDLQKPPYRFDIESIVLEKSAAGQGQVRCQMTLARWSLLAPAP
jgi:hypothetical protein